MLSRREFVIGSGLAASGAVALIAGRERLPGGPTPDLASLVPQALPPWTDGGDTDAILSPDALTLATYEQLLVRRYLAEDGPAMTLVAAHGPAQSYATQLHRPEVCYPASGFTIAEAALLDLRVGGHVLPANILTAHRGLRSDSVLYWSRVGHAYPRNLWEQRRAILEASLRGENLDGVLVRVSCRSTVPRAVEALVDFVESMWAHLPGAGRELVFGFSADRARA